MFTIDNTMSDTLGERIRELRQARGWSLRQLGNKAGLSGAYIHQLESGVRQRPNIEMVKGLAAAFDMTLSEFIGEELTESEIELIQKWATFYGGPNADWTLLIRWLKEFKVRDQSEIEKLLHYMEVSAALERSGDLKRVSEMRSDYIVSGGDNEQTEPGSEAHNNGRQD